MSADSTQSLDLDDTGLTYIDAVDVLPPQPDTVDNDYDESWGEGERGNDSRLLTEPNPLLLLALLSFPYIFLVYNTVQVGVSYYSVLVDLLAYWGYMALLVLGLLSSVKLYCQRQRFLRWAVTLLYNDTPLAVTCMDSGQRCVGVQTADTDFQRQANKLKNKYDGDMRRIRKHIFHMRKKFSQRVRSLKDLATERNNILSKLQLKFPELEHEKDTLVAERDAIEKQLEEEKRRNKELIGRFQRISQQFSRLGHAQYPPPLMSLDLHVQQK